LVVDSALGSKDQVVRSLVFKGLVLPAALQQILSKILTDNDWDEELSDINESSSRWLKFCEIIGKEQPEKGLDDYGDWIDDVIRLVVKKINARANLLDNFEKVVQL